MADKATEPKEVVEETTPAEEETKSENGENATENGEAEENEENGKEAEKEETEKTETDSTTDKVCSIKRKSTAGDAPEVKPADDATPEKKAKLDKSETEAESNGEAEVAA